MDSSAFILKFSLSLVELYIWQVKLLDYKYQDTVYKYKGK